MEPVHPRAAMYPLLYRDGEQVEPSRMGSKSPGNTGQPPAFFSKLTESNSAMVKSKKQEINKKLNTHNRSEPEYSKGAACGAEGPGAGDHGGPLQSQGARPTAPPPLRGPGRPLSLPQALASAERRGNGRQTGTL